MPLSQCNRWALLQLDSRRCRLTKENITESELTLQRAGYFGKTAQQGEKMFVCPIHRATLGKDWGNPTGRTECRYPDHKRKQTFAGEKWQSVGNQIFLRSQRTWERPETQVVQERSRDEWLTKGQVQSFFSRLSAISRKRADQSRECWSLWRMRSALSSLARRNCVCYWWT